MELWLDLDSDEDFGAGDSLLGAFGSGSGTGWAISSLDWPVLADGSILFIVADIDTAATPGTSFHAQLPANGCTFSSANDGPIDSPLSSDDQFQISSSGLSIAYQPLDASYTIGQTIEVAFSATNRLDSTLTDVVGRMVSYDDSASAVADSSSHGPPLLLPLVRVLSSCTTSLQLRPERYLSDHRLSLLQLLTHHRYSAPTPRPYNNYHLKLISSLLIQSRRRSPRDRLMCSRSASN